MQKFMKTQERCGVVHVRLESLPHAPVPIVGLGASLPLLARTLHVLGLHLGATPLSALGTAGGHGWESEYVVRVNQRLLTAVGLTADGHGEEAQLRNAAALMPQMVDGALPLVAKLLSAVFGGGCWGFADPRTAITLPFWLQALQRLGVTAVRPLIVVTTPYEYLASCAHLSSRVGRAEAEAGRDALRYYCAYYRLLEAVAPPSALWIAHDDLVVPERRAALVAGCIAELGLGDGREFAAAVAMEDGLRAAAQSPSPQDWAEPEHDESRVLYERLRARSRFVEGAPLLPSTAGLLADEYCVYVVRQTRAAAARPFEDHALCLQAGLRRLGYRAPIATLPWELRGTPIVLGAHLLSDEDFSRLPDTAILYNLEQVSDGSSWLSESYLSRLRAHPTWDYDAANLVRLRALGVEHGALCQVGCDPQPRRLALRPEAERDIDVLFYGSQNPRRMHVLAQLAAAGLRVVALYNLYGAQRDQFIRRAKVVLNMHFYSAQVLELVRLAYLMANGVCVVTEPGADLAVVGPLRAGLIVSSYEHLVEACRAAVADVARREQTASAAVTLFRQRPQDRYLSALIPRVARAVDDLQPWQSSASYGRLIRYR